LIEYNLVVGEWLVNCSWLKLKILTLTLANVELLNYFVFDTQV